MNYAVDRLDRRARYSNNNDGTATSLSSSSHDLLVEDYSRACFTKDHELWGRTLRDVGWNKHSVYHYGQQWCQNPTSAIAAGDYAQMAELCGFPELGMMALLTYFHHVTTTTTTTTTMNGSAVSFLKDPDPEINNSNDNNNNNNNNNHKIAKKKWNFETVTKDGDGCGCGFASCGTTACFVPLLMEEALTPIFEAFQTFFTTTTPVTTTTNRPTALKLLNAMARGDPLPLSSSDYIPSPLQFWNSSTSSSCDDPERMVLQLLLVKLTFVTIPQLAVEAVPRLSQQFTNKKLLSHLATSHKSHHAYFLLIQAVVLGKRIKPSKQHRSKVHVPLWDQITIPTRNGNGHDSWSPYEDALRQILSSPPSSSSSSIPRAWWYYHPCPKPMQTKNGTKMMTPKPLHIVGDSHVLSLAWQTMRIPTTEYYMFFVPLVITGLKAWHVQRDTCFFTQTNLRTILLHRLSPCPRTILFSAGEIDCREGVGGPLLEGYRPDQYTKILAEHVPWTVHQYRTSLLDWAASTTTNLQILVMPVAPHALQTKGRVTGQAVRRRTTQFWNQELRRQIAGNDGDSGGVYFLDYEQALLSDHNNNGTTATSSSFMPEQHYVLKPELDADGTHMNSAFCWDLAQAMIRCGCHLDGDHF